MFLFILCSLSSWLCPLPETTPLPRETITAETITAESLESDPPDNTYSGLGNPFVAITEQDTGYCGEDLSGSGWSGSLIWPVDNPEINDNRGFRVGHTGIDLNGNTGDPVWAAGFGNVVYSGWSTWGFGNLVVLSHGGGWFTFYAHLSTGKQELKRLGVTCGAFINAGQHIGGIGQTGAATWPHLHFELRNGRFSYDPLQWLPPLSP